MSCYYTPTLVFPTKITSTTIEMITESGAICSLTMDITNSELPGKVFWFSRIKSKIESQGDGTLLMTELLTILDKNHITVICIPLSYGRMTYHELTDWYIKYGFRWTKLDDDEVMVRFPE